MKNIISRIATFAFIIAVFLTIGWKLSANKREAESLVYRFDSARLTLPDSTKIKAIKPTDKLQFLSGTFFPKRQSKLSAESQGVVKKLFFEEGDQVQTRDALVQLDNALLQLQLAAVAVKIEELEADVARFQALDAAGAIQGIQLEKAKFGLRSTIIQKNTLLEQIAKTTISAPFNGVVVAKMTEVGSYAAPAMPLLQIADISQLKFTIYVSETELPKFETGAIHTIQADAFPDISFSGKVTLIGSQANAASSFPIEFTVDNTPEQHIKSGMFGKVAIR